MTTRQDGAPNCDRPVAETIDLTPHPTRSRRDFQHAPTCPTVTGAVDPSGDLARAAAPNLDAILEADRLRRQQEAGR